jgi:FtsH-binding integral membrane protein
MTAQNPPTYGQAGADVSLSPPPELAAQVLTQAFAWMFAGLLVTAGVTFVVQDNQALLTFAGRNWFMLFIGQVGLALGIQFLIRRLNPLLALALFFVYAAAMGLTVGLVVSFYTVTSVATAFFSAASIFGAAAIYGYTTKRPLVKISNMIGILLFGWFVAIAVNLIFPSGPLSIALSLFTVGLFTVITAVDVKQISRGDYIAYAGTPERAAVLGAVHLYISFVNIFLSLLNLLGDRD